MFKKLKDKIAEEVKQSPLKVTHFARAIVPTSSSVIEPSSSNFSITEENDGLYHNPPSEDGFQAIDIQEETSPQIPFSLRSRHSSFSSITSDASSLFPSYEMPGISFNMQHSEFESASEMEDASSSQFTHVSKQDLLQAYMKLQTRYQKYKGRSNDLMKYCRDLDKDNKKHKNVLLEYQEKSIRRINELKEQCALEQIAKAHLEEALRNDLEEKDHLIQTLQTKVKLLKETNNSVSNVLEVGTLIDLQPLEHINTSDDNLRGRTVQLQLDAADTQFKKSKEIFQVLNVNEQVGGTFNISDDDEINRIQKESTSTAPAQENNQTLNCQETCELSEAQTQLNGECTDHIINEKFVKLSSEVELLNEQILDSEKRLEIYRSENDRLVLALEHCMKSMMLLRNCVNTLKQEASSVFENVNEKNIILTLELKELISNVFIKNHDTTQELHISQLELSNIKELYEKQSSEIQQLERDQVKDDANLQIETLKEEVALSNKEKEAMVTKCSELCTSSDLLNFRIQELSHELSTTKDNARQQIDVVNNKLTLAHEGNNVMVTNNMELSKIIDELTAHIQMLDVEIMQLKENKKLDIDVMNDKLTLAHEGNNVMVTNNMELSKIIDEQHAHIQILDVEIMQLKENKKLDIDAINEKLLFAYEEKKLVTICNDELTNSNNKLNAQIQELSDKLSKAQTVELQIDALNKELTIANKEREFMYKENSKLLYNNEHLNVHIDKLSTEFESSQHERKLQIESLNEKLSVLANSELKIEELNKNVLSYRKEKDELMMANSKLSIVNDNLNVCNQKLSSELSKVKNDFKLETIEVIQKLSLANNEKETMSKRSSKLLIDNEQLNVDIQELLKVEHDAKLQIDTLTEKLALANKEKESISKMINVDLSAQYDNLVLENESFSNEILKLKSVNSQLKEELQRNNVSFKESQESVNTLVNSNLTLGLEKKELDYSCKSDLFNMQLEELSTENNDLQKQLYLEMHHAKTMSSSIENYKSKIHYLKSELHKVNSDKDLITRQLNETVGLLEEKEQKIDDLIDVHTRDVKKLLQDFGIQLIRKDQELEDLQAQECERREEKECHEINRLKKQIRDIVKEFEQKNEAFEALLESHNALKNVCETDKMKLELRLQEYQQSHDKELNEVNNKWRAFRNKELLELEHKHKAELSDLSREWHWERKDTTPNTDAMHPKELESTSQLAVAAVESGTGSIELLHKQVVVLTQELKETKNQHKLEIEELNKLLSSLHQRSSEGAVCAFHEDSVEKEYIRNIILQYMMGKESMLLAKVIAAVLKFDEDQTAKILQKEQQKQSLLGQLGIL